MGVIAGAAGTSALGLDRAKAAGYPDRPIKIIVPFAPAGPTDIMARILASHLGEALTGTVIVENRPGAGGNIGIGTAARAEPDGYTLLVTSSAFVVNPGLYAKIPYDPFADFAAIAELGTSPNVILADPRLGLNSIADLVAHARVHPGELNYASPGIGTTPHLSGELLKIIAGLEIVHVPFSGAGPPCRRRTRISKPARSRRSPSPERIAGSTCLRCRPWSNSATPISSPTPFRDFWRRRRRRPRSSSCCRPGRSRC
jgi:tripartite-type tricarboxylate transporter receptor subunit TctC